MPALLKRPKRLTPVALTRIDDWPHGVGCTHRFARATCRHEGIKALIARGFHKPGDVENRLGYYLGQIAR
jgi:hypothetical protein